MDVLTAALTKISSDGRLFQCGDLMPLRDPADNAEVPAYQVYLAVAWLRQLGLADQHGRQGYSVQKLQELPQAVEKAWEELAEA